MTKPLLHLLIKVQASEQLQLLKYGALRGDIVYVINIIQYTYPAALNIAYRPQGCLCTLCIGIVLLTLFIYFYF
jgi:hypothetical protein